MLFQGAGPDITPSARRRSGGSGGRLWDLLRRNAGQAKDAMELAPGDTVDVAFDAVDDALRLQFGKGLCVSQAFGDVLPTDELKDQRCKQRRRLDPTQFFEEAERSHRSDICEAEGAPSPHAVFG